MQVADFITRCNLDNIEILDRNSISDIAEAGAEFAFLRCGLESTSLVEVIVRAIAAASATLVAQFEALCDATDADNSSTMPCNLLQEDVAEVTRLLVCH